MRKPFMIFIVLAQSCLVWAALAYPQGRSEKKRDISTYTGVWISLDARSHPALPDNLLITADEKRLTISKRWARGPASKTRDVEVFVDKRGETNWETRSDGKKVEIKSVTTWESGAFVRRYARVPEQTTEEKTFISERFLLSKDGKKLVYIYISCPESIWPTNSIQETKMCFDKKRTFVRES